MHSLLLYLGATLNLLIAWHALVLRSPDLFWWAVGGWLWPVAGARRLAGEGGAEE